MRESIEKQRRIAGDDYRLNVVQIPLLRGFGFGILCLYVLLYDLLAAPPFSWSQYFPFVAIIALYCTASWLFVRKAYTNAKRFDLSLLFLILDLLFLLL